MVGSGSQSMPPVERVVTPAAPVPAPAPTGTTKPEPRPVPTPAPTPTPAPSGPQGYTMAQVAAHSSKTDCWSAINGSVYNLTTWIGEHPGGAQAIVSICGVDGSAAFNEEHGGERRPANELVGFKIGIVEK